jgi:hypothetical protein
MNFEECEVAKRIPEVDLKLYRETCTKFAQIIKELDEIKTKKNKGVCIVFLISMYLL